MSEITYRDTGIVSCYGKPPKVVLEHAYFDTGNREIHHNIYLDGEGEIEVVVNGSTLDDLANEELIWHSPAVTGSTNF